MSEIEQNLIGLAGIIVLGIGGQCIAARLRVPSILLLLLIGFIAGPITHSIEPDHIFEGLLFPVISLSVAIILFEGGLSLKLDELRQIGRVLVGLLTIGIATTWLLTTLAAWKILGMPPRLAAPLRQHTDCDWANGHRPNAAAYSTHWENRPDRPVGRYCDRPHCRYAGCFGLRFLSFTARDGGTAV